MSHMRLVTCFNAALIPILKCVLYTFSSISYFVLEEGMKLMRPHVFDLALCSITGRMWLSASHWLTAPGQLECF